MTNRRIHINYLPKYDKVINSFINNHREGQMICNEHLRDIILDIDMDDEYQREEILTYITELVLNILRDKNLKEYIWSNYTKLNEEEKSKVYQEARFLINKKEAFIFNTIYNKIDDFIDFGTDINLEGFFCFRMRDFFIYISIISDIALEEYLIKRDKNQFINTLKYFMKNQESKLELLIIHILADGDIKFYNEYYEEIEDLQNQEFVNMIMRRELDSDDIIISVLLALCPKKVEIIDSLNNNVSLEIIENMKILFKENINVIIKN